MINKKPNFLIVLSDCTRPDKLSCYGYQRKTTPNIDKLADEGTIFTNAYTQSVWTLPTHASLFTGLYPSEHGLISATEKLNVQLDESIPTIAEQLRNIGYITACISNNPWVGQLTGFNKGFDFFMESDGTIKDKIGIDVEIPTSIGMINNIQKLSKGFFFKLLIPYLVRRPVFTEFTIDLAKKIINYAEENNRKFFIFMNLMDTHQPYYPPKKELKQICNHHSYPWSSLIANYKIRRFYQGKKVENISQTLNDYYIASLHYQDKQLGSLFSYLRSENIIDDTMIFFTADHGKNLGEYDINKELSYMKDVFLKIPLIVRYPKVFPKNRYIDNYVQLLDINYTIKKQIKLETPHENDISLNETLSDMGRRFSYSEAELPFNFFEQKTDSTNIGYVEAVMGSEGKIIKSERMGLATSKIDGCMERFVFDESEIDETLLSYLEDHKKKNVVSEKQLIKNLVKKKIPKI